jgi:hypothetical protein
MNDPAKIITPQREISIETRTSYTINYRSEVHMGSVSDVIV